MSHEGLKLPRCPWYSKRSHSGLHRDKLQLKKALFLGKIRDFEAMPEKVRI
jgi:hypothetical protein